LQAGLLAEAREVGAGVAAQMVCKLIVAASALSKSRVDSVWTNHMSSEPAGANAL
jgi:hypothetical protein